jgi:hypothetical protein
MRTSLITLTFYLATVLAATAAPPKDDTFQLFHKLRTVAVDAQTHATALETLARSPGVSWESQMGTLDRLKTDINLMGKILSTLKDRPEGLSAAEWTELDRATPALRELASDTAAAIRFLAESREPTWRPSYQKPVENLAGASARLSKSLRAYVEIVTLRAKQTRIEEGLAAGGM